MLDKPLGQYDPDRATREMARATPEHFAGAIGRRLSRAVESTKDAGRSFSRSFRRDHPAIQMASRVLGGKR